jgi:hypothetical protein
VTDLLDALTRIVVSKLHILGLSTPRVSLIRAVIDRTYFASLRTEEGRFVRGSLTFTNPQKPDINPPIIRRAEYPGFTFFDSPMRLTPELLVRLFRAVDQWVGSIAVYGTSSLDLVAWGVVDQMVHENIHRNRESDRGFSNPGLFTVTIDSTGTLSVYHRWCFLAGLRQGQLITRENPALRSRIVIARVKPVLAPIANGIAMALHTPGKYHRIFASVSDEWSRTIERLCIGLRRLGTGGAFLISPKPVDGLLDVGYRFHYNRLSNAAFLAVLDRFHLKNTKQQVSALERQVGGVSTKVLRELTFAEEDSQDRDSELTGAIRLATTLASIDGLVLLKPSLEIVGFGVKVKSNSDVRRIYDGAYSARKGARVKMIEPTRFGTRHGSVLRYCSADTRAIGVVVSQDGQVRVIMTANRRLMLWDNVKLLRYDHNVRRFAKELHRWRSRRNKSLMKPRLGYSSTPKTLEELLRVKK